MILSVMSLTGAPCLQRPLVCALSAKENVQDSVCP
jgi:hypothetical protein